MNKLGSENTIAMLSVLGLLLVVIGTRAAWMNLPLSGSIPGLEGEFENYGKVADLFRWTFLVTILLAVVSSLLRYRLITVQITFVSFLILLFFVVYNLFQEHEWIVRYMDQSEERKILQRFISKYYWPNINPDHTVTLITKYEYLWERLELNWSIVGIGWKIALLGTIILSFISVIRSQVSLSVIVVAGTLFTVVILVAFAPLIKADVIHQQGDDLLNTGKYHQALDAYDAALHLDPMLEYSTPFLIKVSYAYYKIEAEYSLLGGLHLLHTTSLSVDTQRLTPAFRIKLKQARLSIDNVAFMDGKGTVLQNAVISQMHKKNASLWVSQGLLEYENNRLVESIKSFHEALSIDSSNVHVKYFLAHVLLELNQHNDAQAFLKSALKTVWSKQLRADFLCTIGEAYSQVNEPLLARAAYTSCYELDSVYNYRAVLNLGGT